MVRQGARSARSAANYHHFDPWPVASDEPSCTFGGKNSYFGLMAGWSDTSYIDMSIEMSGSMNDNFIVFDQ